MEHPRQADRAVEWLAPEAEHSHPTVECLETLLNLEWEVSAGETLIEKITASAASSRRKKQKLSTHLPRWRIRLKSPE